MKITSGTWRLGCVNAFCVIVTTALSGCVSIADLTGRENDVSADAHRSIDATSEFLSTVGNGDFHSRGEVFSIRANGSFTFTTKLNVRYFVNPGNSNRTELDSICGVTLQGDLKYFDQEWDPASFEGHILRLDLASTKITPTDARRGDDVDPLHSDVCGLYAHALLKQHSVRMVVKKFGPNELVGDWASLNIYEKAAQDWVFNAEPPSASWTASSDRYYLNGVSSVDVTQDVLNGLNGAYAVNQDFKGINASGTQIFGFHDYEVQVNAALKSMRVINHTCGLRYDYKANAVQNNGDRFFLRASIAEKSKFTPDPRWPMPAPNTYFFEWESLQSCVSFEKFLNQIGEVGMAFDFSDSSWFVSDSPLNAVPWNPGADYPILYMKKVTTSQ